MIEIKVHTGDGKTICRNDDWTLFVEGVAVLDEGGFRNPESPTVLQAAILDMADRLTRYEAALREIEDCCIPSNGLFSGCVYCDDAYGAAKTALGDAK